MRFVDGMASVNSRAINEWRGRHLIKVAEMVNRKTPLTRAQLMDVGRPIRGSNLVRDFCVGCSEAIRVVAVSSSPLCLDCRATGVPGKRAGASPDASAIEYHGGQFHAAEW